MAAAAINSMAGEISKSENGANESGINENKAAAWRRQQLKISK